MADVASSAPSAPAQSSPKKAARSKKPRVKPSHPRTSEMVSNAIKNLKERGGSSLQAIKKYIAANYKVDAEKLAPFIKKYLKSAVSSGALVQTKGKGASGSFKLSATSLKEKGAKKPAAGPAKPKKTAPKEKKPKTAKKSAAKKPKKTGEKKKAAPAKPKKTPSKVKKAKSPKKPKTPKPKKAAKPKAASKKATPKKK